MKKERLIWIGIIAAVLLGSWLIQSAESGRSRVLPSGPSPTEELVQEVHTNTANVYNLQEDVAQLMSRVSALENATHIH